MQERVVKDGSIHNVCPVDLRPLPAVHASTPAEVQGTVAVARAAQASWDALGFEARAKLLKRAGRRMLERRQEVLELLHHEAGKTPAEILMSEALGPLQYISDWIGVVRPYLKPRKLPINPIAFQGKRGVIEVVPRGVVGIIAPWNYPLANFFKPVFAALLTGNAVVLKPSEHSPRTAAWFVDAMGEFLPAGVLTCVQGDREAGQALVCAGIDAVTFTGSYSSGVEVARLAAGQMIPCSCELGGKDAALVLADCDLDRTVAGIMHWRFHNAGQACGAIERVYVEASIADAFLERMTAAVSRLRVHSGNPQTSDVGPLVHPAQLAVVEEQVADAIARGARVLCGGKRVGKGLWFEPTVLEGCDHSMKIMTEPTFGPVLPVMRVADADEAVALANDCAYGLNASVWAGDRTRAEALGRQLEVGTVFVNNHAFTGAIAAAPWTGVKHSGYGIANSAFALGHYTRPRTVVVDRSTSPEPFWFPINETLEELGHRLADVQVGKVGSAWKLPLLILRRKRQVSQFVQEDGPAEKPATPLPQRRLSGFRDRLDPSAWMGRVRQHAQLPLTQRELSWARAAVEAIFTGERDSRLPDPLSRESWDAFLQDMVGSAPLLSGLGLRAAIWGAAASPLLLRKWATLDRVSPHDRQQAIQAMNKSEFYLLRQIAVLLKTTGALAQTSTTRMQAAALRPPTRPSPVRVVSGT